MATYVVYLEGSPEALAEGGYLAHVPQLLGCTARGATPEEAIALAGRAVDEALAVLRREGLEAPPADEPVDLEIVDTVAATYPEDLEPLDSRTLDTVAALAAASRRELLALLDAAPNEALHGSASDAEWPLHSVISHVAGADFWYASRLSDDGLPELTWRLAATRALVLDRLRGIEPGERARVTIHSGEEWTPRKVARRLLEHEREHLSHARELLARFERQRPT